MKGLSFLFLSFLCLISLRFPALLSSIHDSVPINDNLLNELKFMCQEDQAIRFKVLNAGSFAEEMEKVDQKHLIRLKEIVNEFGWPGFLLVGEEGADCVWLLAQHCDRYVEFQKRCLSLLDEAVRKEDAPKRHLAYLKDRVLVNEGQKQIYGTQIEQIMDGQPILRPLQEPDNVDKRREEMGLCPLDEYLSLVREFHHSQKQNKSI